MTASNERPPAESRPRALFCPDLWEGHRCCLPTWHVHIPDIRTHAWSDGSRYITWPGTETCGDPSVTGGCGRPKNHRDGHSPYRILDDPGAVPIEELMRRIEDQRTVQGDDR